MSSIEEIAPNTVLKLDMDTFKEITRFSFKTFDLVQHKDSFGDYHAALIRAVRMRANSAAGVFLGVSSGYDSGAVAAVGAFVFTSSKTAHTMYCAGAAQ
jgi:asparagine synthetase B (glutamine-hydrolysing)